MNKIYLSFYQITSSHHTQTEQCDVAHCSVVD